LPFDGSGVFLRLRNWVADAAAGVKIRADMHDDEDNNFASGLTNCIARDGQTTVTQNLPMNSKRVTALADPVNPQDAATKAYADTKLAQTGNGTITGNLGVTGNLDVAGNASAFGYKTRKGLPGPYGGSFFNFDWTGNLEAWVDNTNLGALATQAFANTKLPLAGGTITGNLQVNGELGSAANIVRFGAIGSSPGYLQWNGGSTYTLGGGGTVWHSGNFNPATNVVTGARLAFAGDREYLVGAFAVVEPYAGAAMSSTWAAVDRIGIRWRYLQVNIGGGWYTVGYA
jgi:hypothetical protein